MIARRLTPSSSRSGYTLVEVLAASGLIAGAIAACSALSMNMSRQEELTRCQSAAIRYAEAVARIWQLGVNPESVLLLQPYAKPDNPNVTGDETASLAYYTMTPTISEPVPVSMGSDGGFSQGTVEQSTVTVTYLPYGSQTNATIVFDVLRPVASHR